MFDLFKFRLPIAVTEQLIAKLELLQATPLTKSDLHRLAEFQRGLEMQAGVYVLYMEGIAVYAGKADGLVDRLQQHLEKIRGRVLLATKEIRYKALVLDENWSTSANEGLLIKHFKQRGECEWNKAGFGPKDPGKNRDGYQPNKFDTRYPIDTDWMLSDIADIATVGEVLNAMKEQLPYTMRFELNQEDLEKKLKLKGVQRTALALATTIAGILGKDFQFMVFKSHLVLYKSRKQYAHGTILK
ncbi:MAG: Eco29kI family restriction endonuclease [Flavobacteriales bacterium]|jgi:predicted GIY-YIG superfamily endonuclease|nr:Eco29kI family restriction endonuclease [Flavobacteriales bacterium]MBK6892677.1 Eco29kI family restriction endonuclease [Flavobacteriales bacterium]MBK7246818.1 Eco29kI family restriction endonuclease [Flavobacteriales bacterium]MBK9599203.1 Eco29kI family restriction endonuclease [Flavobacteriales bacterium]